MKENDTLQKQFVMHIKNLQPIINDYVTIDKTKDDNVKQINKRLLSYLNKTQTFYIDLDNKLQKLRGKNVILKGGANNIPVEEELENNEINQVNDTCIVCLGENNEQTDDGENLGPLVSHNPQYDCSALAHVTCWNDMYERMMERENNEGMCVQCHRILRFNANNVPEAIRDGERTDMAEQRLLRLGDLGQQNGDRPHWFLNMLQNIENIPFMRERPYLIHTMYLTTIITLVCSLIYIAMNMYAFHYYQQGVTDSYSIVGVEVYRRERETFYEEFCTSLEYAFSRMIRDDTLYIQRMLRRPSLFRFLDIFMGQVSLRMWELAGMDMSGYQHLYPRYGGKKTSHKSRKLTRKMKRSHRKMKKTIKSNKKNKKVKRTRRLRKLNKRNPHKKTRRRRRNRTRTRRGGDGSDDESHRSSFSSLGDFETEDMDDIREIMELIHTHIFFGDTAWGNPTGYSDERLTELINNLDIYDLYRRIEYIRDATYKLIPDSNSGLERKTGILLMLDILIEDTVPNTRSPTPVTELMRRDNIDDIEDIP